MGKVVPIGAGARDDDDVIRDGVFITSLWAAKGTGKTFRMTLAVLEALRSGAHVVTVGPRYDPAAFGRYLGDSTVVDRMTVCDYDRLTDDDFFFRTQDARTTKWRDAVVRPGTQLFIDEVWRWFGPDSLVEVDDNSRAAREKAKQTGIKQIKFEKFSKTPSGRKLLEHLKMLRHYKGPSDYTDPVVLRLASDPLWSPERAALDGDPIAMRSCGLMVVVQDYNTLDKGLVGQVDEVIEIRRIGKITDWLKSLFGLGKFKPVMQQRITKGNRPLTKVSEKRMQREGMPVPSYSVIADDPDVHRLKGELAGDEISISRLPGESRVGGNTWFIRIVVATCVLLIVGIGWSIYRKHSGDKMPKAGQTTSKASTATSTTPLTESGTTALRLAAPSKFRVVGSVGTQLVVADEAGKISFADSSRFVRTQAGWIGEIDNESVTSWSGSIAGGGSPAAPGTGPGTSTTR